MGMILWNELGKCLMQIDGLFTAWPVANVGMPGPVANEGRP